MTQPTDHSAELKPALPAATLVAWVGGACLGVFVLTALAVPALDLTDGWRVWSTATMVTLVSAAASLPWLIVAGKAVRLGDDPKRTADQMPKAAGLVMFAGVARAAVVGAATLLVIRGLRLPTWPSFGMIGFGYVALLATEAGVAGRAFWHVDAATRSRPSGVSAVDADG